MIRTQISLAKEEYEQAKKEARNLGIPFAEFVRRVIRPALPVSGELPHMRYCGMISSGKSWTNEEIDELLYGRKE